MDPEADRVGVAFFAGAGLTSVTGLAVDEEGGLAHREQSHPIVPVGQLDELPVVAALETDHGTAESGGGILDDEVAFGRHLRDGAAPTGVAGEDVAAVDVAVAVVGSHERRG